MFAMKDDPDLNAKVLASLERLVGSSRFAGLAEATALRAIYLSPDVSGPPAIGASKVNGAPDLPDHIDYPEGPQGLYLFHAQLNLADLAPFQEFLPRKGMLWFFSSDEQFQSDTHAKVIFDPECSVDMLTRWTVPDDKDFGDDNFHIHNEHGVTASVGPSFCGSAYYDLEKLFPEFARTAAFSEDDIDEFIDYTQDCEEALFIPRHAQGVGKYIVHCLNGFADDGFFPEGTVPHTEWTTLLCLESIAGRNVWDAGAMSFTIRKDRLAEADFSQVLLSLKSH